MTHFSHNSYSVLDSVLGGQNIEANTSTDESSPTDPIEKKSDKKINSSSSSNRKNPKTSTFFKPNTPPSCLPIKQSIREQLIEIKNEFLLSIGNAGGDKGEKVSEFMIQDNLENYKKQRKCMRSIISSYQLTNKRVKTMLIENPLNDQQKEEIKPTLAKLIKVRDKINNLILTLAGLNGIQDLAGPDGIQDLAGLDGIQDNKKKQEADESKKDSLFILKKSRIVFIADQVLNFYLINFFMVESMR